MKELKGKCVLWRNNSISKISDVYKFIDDHDHPLQTHQTEDVTKQLHDLGAIRVASWFLCGFVRQKDFVPQKKDSRELRTLRFYCQTFAPALPSAVSPEQTGFFFQTTTHNRGMQPGKLGNHFCNK